MSYTLIQRQPLADAPEKLKLRGVRSFGVSVFFPLNRCAAGCSLLHHQGLVARTCFWEEGTQQFKNPCEQRLFFWVGRVVFLVAKII